MADNNTEYRVGQLEAQIEVIGQDVKTIMTNHLPHMKAEIVRLSTTVKIFGGLILTALSALIALAIS